jgi:2-oxoglutarate dehydrogenase E2 component (dihydrolipoamide succinyltransferase)
MRVPNIGESITEVTLSQWLKENGEFVKLDEPICEFESDKATLEFPAEAEGKLIYVAAEDDDIEIGGLVARIDTSFAAPASKDTPAVEEAPASETKTEEAPAAPAQSATYATGHPSPAAGKILRENNVNPTDVLGTGKDGRITKEDAQKAAQSKPAPAAVSAPKVNAPAAATAYSRGTREEKMSRMRRTIATRLVSAKNSTAMLTTFNEVDLSEVMKLRKRVQEKFVEKHGVKLGFMSLFAKACSNVLMEMPDVNAMINGNNIIFNDFVDISIAISTPTGLVVPPVRNVESMDFHEIELAIKGLAVKAREGKLTLDEMKGGTFTITNGGVFGSLVSTPIINEPQSAILGMHAIKERPVAINGQVEIRPMMYLALSYDHRVIDGSTSVTFLVKVKEQLEDPMKLLLNI